MARSFTSSRAWKLHLSVLIWTPACIVAGWWQATRAMDGNALSYLYATEWPLLAGLGIWAWWMLLSTEPASPEQAAERQAFEQAERIKIAAARKQALDKDPNMAQYNEQLAQLAEEDRRNS